MLAEGKYLSVNWINGMKVSSQNFIELENWMHDRLKDVIGLTLDDFNYGLLDPVNPEKNSLELDTNVDQVGSLNLNLLECRAITRGGHRIEITRSMAQQHNISLDYLSKEFNLENFPNQQFDIIITVNPFSRIPVGMAVPQESPFRPPFVMPEYKLEIVPSDQMKSSLYWYNHLIIGKFQVISGEVHFFSEYIPPCTRNTSHPLLVQNFRTISNNLSELGKNCILILRRLKYKEQQGRLDLNVIQLMTTISDYIANNTDKLEYNIQNESPIQLVIYFKTLFRIIKNDLQKLIDYDRDELTQYFARWISSSELDDEVTRIIGINYDHVNCNFVFKLIHQIMDKLLLLTEKLSGSTGENIPSMPPPRREEPVKPKVNIVRSDRGMR